MPFAFDTDSNSGKIGVGQHTVEIVETKERVSSTGKPQLQVIYETPDGAQLPDYLTAGPRSAWVWERLWSAAGLASPVVDDKLVADESALIGRRVNIEVFLDDYINKEGKPQTSLKVKDVWGLVGGDVPIDEVKSEPVSTSGGFAAAAGITSDDAEEEF